MGDDMAPDAEAHDEAFQVIWSFAHAAEPDFDHAKTLIDMGVGLGIDGVEIAYGLENCLVYTHMPALRRGGDTDEILAMQREIQRIAEYAAGQGLRVGVWLHEVSGPPGLLDLLPELRAADGFLDLESPLLAELIEAQINEFLDAAPAVDEIVLTLTETQVCVLRRPFCSMPPVERAAIVVNAVTEAVRYYGKGLVVRPFSALPEDSRAILEAAGKLRYEATSVMMKTEPADWNPFLPVNPLLRKVGRHELRAEADACGEYYGQTFVPACYPEYLLERLRAAAERGAKTFALRADRRGHSVVGTLNEINLIAATAWAKDQTVDVGRLWRLWMQARLGAAPDGLREILGQTFEVVKNSLYIDGQQISHDGFPSFEDAQRVQLFHLFEPAGNLRHMRDHWSILSDRATIPHAEIVSAQQETVEMAASLGAWFDSIASELSEEGRDQVRQGLARLSLVARSCLALVRAVAAHLEDAWRAEPRAVGAFDEEADRLLGLADEVAAAEGEEFFGHAPARMRGFVEALRRERRVDPPRRETLDAEPGLVDYVLCGLASEGHKLGRRLHTGGARLLGDTHFRESGVGECEGFGYELRVPPGQAFSLEIDMVGGRAPAEGVAWLGPNKFDLRCDAPEGRRQTLTFESPGGSAESPARLEIWSTGAEPCRVAEIRVKQASSPKP